MAGTDPSPDDEEQSQRWWRTGEWPLQRWRTGEWPALPRIDLSEAYANVRSRAKHLRRRRIISSIVAAVVFIGLFTVVGVYYISTIPLPDATTLPATTTVYYSDGHTVMARLGTQRRTIIDVRSLPGHIGEAVVAAEDPAFWLDSSSMISRQYARAATGMLDSSAGSQARLLVLSWKLEDTYDKQEILGFYLNTVYFGRGSYGIEAAARSYFGKGASSLTRAEAVVLAGMIASPGDGRYDPTVNPVSARSRFLTIVQRMVTAGTLTQTAADALRMPAVLSYDPALFASDLDKPTGLVVSQVLAELRQREPFKDAAPGYLEDGGFAIVTTIDPGLQAVLEGAASSTADDSVMAGQPGNLQAAAVVVEPGTGRVLAYYGGENGAGADYAGPGFGAHPPGQTFGVFTLAAALDEQISLASRWDSPVSRTFDDVRVQDVYSAPCQPTCTLTEAATASLNVPLYAAAARVGPAAVIDMARAAGIRSMWVPATATEPAREVDLTGTRGSAVTPTPFDGAVGLGTYPVTVLDQANAMATFAAGGEAATAHFLLRVTEGGGSAAKVVVAEPGGGSASPVLAADAVADLTWALAQNPAGRLAEGWSTAAMAGSAALRDNSVETAHAWFVGYTADLALAVWVGNADDELPLKDRNGARVTGTGLPAEIYRTVLVAAYDELGLAPAPIPPAANVGDPAAGDAP